MWVNCPWMAGNGDGNVVLALASEARTDHGGLPVPDELGVGAGEGVEGGRLPGREGRSDAYPNAYGSAGAETEVGERWR